jgi:hypothetical protein
LSYIQKVDNFAKNEQKTFKNFLSQSHYSQSVMTGMSEEESIVATFMKYYGKDFDREKLGL